MCSPLVAPVGDLKWMQTNSRLGGGLYCRLNLAIHPTDSEDMKVSTVSNLLSECRTKLGK
jgi:hypothetical protein